MELGSTTIRPYTVAPGGWQSAGHPTVPTRAPAGPVFTAIPTVDPTVISTPHDMSDKTQPMNNDTSKYSSHCPLALGLTELEPNTPLDSHPTWDCIWITFVSTFLSTLVLICIAVIIFKKCTS